MGFDTFFNPASPSPVKEAEPKRVAPGKTSSTNMMGGAALKAMKVMASLTPDLVEILDSADTERIVKALKRISSGKGILDAAFEYARTKHGDAFVERLSRAMFPRRQADWLGMSDILDEHHSDGDPANDPLDRRPESTTVDAVEQDDFYVRAQEWGSPLIKTSRAA
jgi:hypothetical protein